MLIIKTLPKVDRFLVTTKDYLFHVLTVPPVIPNHKQYKNCNCKNARTYPALGQAEIPAINTHST